MRFYRLYWLYCKWTHVAFPFPQLSLQHLLCVLHWSQYAQDRYIIQLKLFSNWFEHFSFLKQFSSIGTTFCFSQKCLNYWESLLLPLESISLTLIVQRLYLLVWGCTVQVHGCVWYSSISVAKFVCAFLCTLCVCAYFPWNLFMAELNTVTVSCWLEISVVTLSVGWTDGRVCELF